jgi:hypothetical protein
MDRSDALVLTVYPNGGKRDRRQHLHIRNTGDGEFDITGFTIRFDTGQEYELQALGDARSLELLPGGELLVLTARECKAKDGMLLSYPGVHIRNARFAESALTDGGTVSIVDADDELVAEATH